METILLAAAGTLSTGGLYVLASNVFSLICKKIDHEKCSEDTCNQLAMSVGVLGAMAVVVAGLYKYGVIG